MTDAVQEMVLKHLESECGEFILEEEKMKIVREKLLEIYG